MINAQLLTTIHDALKDLLSTDSMLFEYKVGERAITHKLAEHLQRHIGNEYHVDCEYDRIETAGLRKKALLYMDIEHQLSQLVDEETAKEVLKSLVYPDIVIHQRGTAINRCVIEFKKASRDLRHDEEKLKSYTAEADPKLHYDLGILIVCNGIQVSYKYFTNGEEVTERSLLSLDNQEENQKMDIVKRAENIDLNDETYSLTIYHDISISLLPSERQALNEGRNVNIGKGYQLRIEPGHVPGQPKHVHGHRDGAQICVFNVSGGSSHGFKGRIPNHIQQYIKDHHPEIKLPPNGIVESSFELLVYEKVLLKG